MVRFNLLGRLFSSELGPFFSFSGMSYILHLTFVHFDVGNCCWASMLPYGNKSLLFSTDMNAVSSRSHALFSLTIHQTRVAKVETAEVLFLLRSKIAITS